MPRRRQGRVALIVALAAIIVLGPPFKWAFDEPWNPLRMWAMFGHSGVGVCDVHYFRRDATGDHPLDRWALLEVGDPWSLSPAERSLSSGVLVRQGEELCKQLRFNGERRPDVRVQARCATEGGWRRRHSKKRNLCALEEGGE